MSVLSQARRDIDRAEEIGSRLDERAELSNTAALAQLSEIEYDKIREAAAKVQGIRTSTLDSAVKRLRKADSKTEDRGHEVIFDEPEPWQEPIDGNKLLADIYEVVNRFVVMPSEAVVVCVLWVTHTWVFDAARISPILAITSPDKRCGKTTLLEVLMSLVRRALSASNITAAALFRAVEKYAPTLGIDEADTFLGASDELRGILNSGHRRRSASVIRTTGDDHEPRQFRTWAPKAIALIGKLPPTLADRSVKVALRRRGPGESVERWRDESFPELRRKLARWAEDHTEELKSARPELPAGLHDRALDNWESLLAIADACGGDWPERARTAARKLSGESDDDSVVTLLLSDVREVFSALHAERITSTNLCEHLASLESRPWPEWGRAQKPITPRQLARLLEPFRIRPKQARQGESNFRGYDRADFEEAFSRYLPSPSATALQSPQDKGFSDSVSATKTEGVADGKDAKPAQDGVCSGVADGSPYSEELEL